MGVASPDNRLSLVAKMVKNCNCAADIGCDHAALPIFLVSGGICEYALACDLREGPLENAKKNIRLAGLEDKIFTRLCNGLDGVKPFEAEEITIAGMGGLLISEILAEAGWVKSEKIGLVLQPMTHASSLRAFLYKNGFEIIKERAATAAGHVYAVMRAEYTGSCQQKDDFFLHTGRMTENPGSEEINYINFVESKMKKRLEGMKGAKDSYDEEIARLEELLKKFK